MNRRIKGGLTKRLCEKQNSGMTLNEAAKAFGYTRTWIRAKLKTAGYCFLPMANSDTGNADRDQEIRKQLAALINNGKTSSEVAQAIGVSRQRISQLLTSMNLCFRPVNSGFHMTPAQVEKKAQKNRDGVRAWRERNPEQVKQQLALYTKRRYKRDPAWVVKHSLKNRYRAALTGGASVTGELLAHLGCSIEEARLHLEKQFEPGMTWDNHGLHGWHIDHIRPVASFDLSLIKDRKQCFHFSNLQPLWAEDNLAKSDKWEAVAA